MLHLDLTRIVLQPTTKAMHLAQQYCLSVMLELNKFLLHTFELPFFNNSISVQSLGPPIPPDVVTVTFGVTVTTGGALGETNWVDGETVGAVVAEVLMLERGGGAGATNPEREVTVTSVFVPEMQNSDYYFQKLNGKFTNNGISLYLWTVMRMMLRWLLADLLFSLQSTLLQKRKLFVTEALLIPFYLISCCPSPVVREHKVIREFMNYLFQD